MVKKNPTYLLFILIFWGITKVGQIILLPLIHFLNLTKNFSNPIQRMVSKKKYPKLNSLFVTSGNFLSKEIQLHPKLNKTKAAKKLIIIVSRRSKSSISKKAFQWYSRFLKAFPKKLRKTRIFLRKLSIFILLLPIRLVRLILSPFIYLDRSIPKTLKISILVMGILMLTAFYSYTLLIFAADLPTPSSLSQIQTPSTTEFYDRNGILLYRLYEGRNRTLVSLDSLPKHLVDATVAIEDKYFYTHKGVDPIGIVRAAWVYLTKKEVQGGSTITQQLIKNTLLTTDRNWQRKSREIILAVWAEMIYSKQQILQMYFNESPYGGPAWGIEAAALQYFDKSAKDLTLAESAYLAGLPASPTTYSPFGTNPELGRARQKDVLRRMSEDGYISSQEADDAANQEMEFSQTGAEISAPHFVMYLRFVLAQKYGEKVVSQGGLKVVTTIDLNLQTEIEGIVSQEVANLSYLRVSNGAAMVMDPKTGQILAMVGSKDYNSADGGNFNVALALRQPGSSIKPITYATAFKQGYSPGNILLDSPVTFKNFWESYSPLNYDNKFHGPVTIRTALGSSYNVPAVKMLSLVGISNMITTAKDLGITTFTDPSRFGLSLTLGGGEVRLIDMMSVYSTFANNGKRVEPNGVLKITDSYGTILEEEKVTESQVISPSVAYLINDILADNKARTPAFGSSSLLNIPGHIVAVKTGTTDLKRDNWTFGYTPDYVVGVWVGNNNNTPMDRALSSGITGAAPIWNKIMTKVLKDKPNVAFARPSDVIQVMVDGRRDFGISGLLPKSAIAVNRRTPKPKDNEKKDDKESITFTDPFSTFVSPANPQ